MFTLETQKDRSGPYCALIFLNEHLLKRFSLFRQNKAQCIHLSAAVGVVSTWNMSHVYMYHSQAITHKEIMTFYYFWLNKISFVIWFPFMLLFKESSGLYVPDVWCRFKKTLTLVNPCWQVTGADLIFLMRFPFFEWKCKCFFSLSWLSVILPSSRSEVSGPWPFQWHVFTTGCSEVSCLYLW